MHIESGSHRNGIYFDHVQSCDAAMVQAQQLQIQSTFQAIKMTKTILDRINMLHTTFLNFIQLSLSSTVILINIKSQLHPTDHNY